jgi:hypothetical protein
MRILPLRSPPVLLPTYALVNGSGSSQHDDQVVHGGAVSFRNHWTTAARTSSSPTIKVSEMARDGAGGLQGSAVGSVFCSPRATPGSPRPPCARSSESVTHSCEALLVARCKESCGSKLGLTKAQAELAFHPRSEQTARSAMRRLQISAAVRGFCKGPLTDPPNGMPFPTLPESTEPCVRLLVSRVRQVIPVNAARTKPRSGPGRSNSTTNRGV